VVFQIDVDPTAMTLANVRVNGTPITTANTVAGFTDFPLGIIPSGNFVELSFELSGCSWIPTAGGTLIITPTFQAVDNLNAPIPVTLPVAITLTVTGAPNIVVISGPIQQTAHNNTVLVRAITYR